MEGMMLITLYLVIALACKHSFLVTRPGLTGRCSLGQQLAYVIVTFSWIGSSLQDQCIRHLA
jgi:hypothetical protein